MKHSILLSITAAAVMCTSVQGYPPSFMAPPEVSALCPNPPGKYPLLLPNPTDCGSFYICSWDNTAFLQHCPSVLHFNPNLQVCDSPTKVKCNVSTTAALVTDKSTPEPTVKTTPAPASNSTFIPDFNSTTTAVPDTDAVSSQRSLMDTPRQVVVTTPPKVAAQCPPYSPEAVAMIPDATNCANFYMCLGDGSAILQHCPSYLLFNPSLQVCDYPQNVHCQVTTQSPVTNKTTPVPTLVNTPAHISNLTNIPDLNSTIPDVPVTTVSSRQSKGLKEIVTAPPEVAVLCPNPPGQYPLLLSNPSDCGSFYICSWYGVAYLQHCPSVLHFNPTLQVCDSPAKVKCVISTTTAPVTDKSTPSSTIKTTPTSVSNSTFFPDFNSTKPAATEVLLTFR